MIPLDPQTRERLSFSGPRLADYEARRQHAATLFERGDLEGALRRASDAAIQAYSFLGGFFSDPGLDDLLATIGQHVLGSMPKQDVMAESSRQPSANDVLHLVSYTGFVGGHTELLRLWLRTLHEQGRRQGLYSTEILATVELERWGELVELADKCYFSNSALSFTQRIVQLAKFIDLIDPKLITLFIHPHDVIVVATLGAIRRQQEKPFEVVIVNHADHAFWLGASVADRTIEFRQVGEIYTRRYRGINKTNIIPLTCSAIDTVQNNGDSRQGHRDRIRQQLGIPLNSTLSLTVASLYKILGGRWDYFNAIVHLLHAQPEHHHLLILGQGEDLFIRRAADAGLADRFHVIGKQADLVPYYTGADFLIETFPLMGGNVRQEAMAFGCPMIVVNPPGFEQNTPFLGLPDRYPIVAHQVELEAVAAAFIQQPKERERLGEGLATFARQRFSSAQVRGSIARFVDDLLAGHLPDSTPAVDDGKTFPFASMYQQYALSKAEQEFLAGAPDRGLAELSFAESPNEPTPAMNAVIRRHLDGRNQMNYGDENHRLLSPALIAWAQGDISKAIHNTEQAIQLRPSLTAGWRLLAELSIDLDQRDRAMQALARAVSIDPNEHRALLLLAQIFVGCGDLARANSSVQQILQRNEHDVDALLLLAQLCERAKRPELAATFHQSAAQIEPRHPRIAGPGPWFSPGEKAGVSVIVTAMNNLLLTHRCLESIRFLGDRRIEEIIVVDDASNDGTWEYIEARASRWDLIHPVKLDSRKGFAAAANTAARIARSPYLLFVDNDVELRPQAVASLAEILDRDPQVALVQAKLLFPHGEIEHAGYGFVQTNHPGRPIEAHSIRRGWNPADPTLNVRRRWPAVTASTMLARKEVFQAVDGFDEGFINGMEDIDLSLRVGLAGGWAIYEPGAVGIHVGQASGWARWKHRAENHRRFWSRWNGQIEPDFILQHDGSRQRVAGSKVESYSLPEPAALIV
jgi:GT2 family glycosyltransferase/glycosyltransferase involved in cell wall biosynthesis